MINSILTRSISLPEKSSLKSLFFEKLKMSGLSKTQYENLANIQRRSLDGILDKTSKQTDIINLLKLGEFLELSFEDLLVFHFKDRPVEEIKELQTSMDITFINKSFDIKTLASLGFIEKESTVDDLKERVCH